MKFKVLFVIAIILIYAASCKDDPTPTVYFDHATQATKDNDSLVEYMQTHYVDSNGELKLIDNNQTPVYDLVTTQIVTHKWDYTGESHDVSVDYKLYYYVMNQGIHTSPTKLDSAYISYKGILLDHSVFDQNNYGTWFNLNSTIKGFSYGMEHFKTGDWTTNSDSSFLFSDYGKGILFIPSGLGYANVYNDGIPVNSPLIFYVNVHLMRRIDYDGDGIYSIYEDVNYNGDYEDDDTDADGIPNYKDVDDDGDGTLTKNENPDPNGDKNPSDALDENTNGIPDYLDPLTK